MAPQCLTFISTQIWAIFEVHYISVGQKFGDVENSFHILYIFEPLQPRGCSWRGYATQEADQELKWKLRTISVWENWVLEFLGSHSWDTREGGLAPAWDSTSKSPHLIGLKDQEEIIYKNDFSISSYYSNWVSITWQKYDSYSQTQNM